MYNGKEYENALDVYNFGARMYDPTTGRWFVPDPIDQFSDFSPYGFVLNDPMNLIDPDGMQVFGAKFFDKVGHTSFNAVVVKAAKYGNNIAINQAIKSIFPQVLTQLVSNLQVSKVSSFVQNKYGTGFHMEQLGNSDGVELSTDELIGLNQEAGDLSTNLAYGQIFGAPGTAELVDDPITGFAGFAAKGVIKGTLKMGAKQFLKFTPRIAKIEIKNLAKGGMTGMRTAISLSKQGFANGATAQLTMANGNFFVGVSSGVKPFQLTDEMTGILMNAGRTGTRAVPSWFGGCAEVSAIQQARAAGFTWSQIRSATLEAYNIGGTAGSIKPFCAGCLNMLDILPK